LQVKECIHHFKKLWVQELMQDSIWTFTYANINNTDSMTVHIDKANYTNKLFAYHNMLLDSTMNREPNTKWDVLFTRYGAFYTQFGQTIFSTNTGVLSHPLTLTSKVKGVAISQAEPGVYTHNLTGIGTDWKENPGPGQPNFRVYDSLSYFTKTLGDREDKLVFETFRGASTGVIIFNKTNIKLGTGLSKVQANNAISMYPNPAEDVVNINLKTASINTVKIISVVGAEIEADFNRSNNTIEVSHLKPGIYLLSITTGSGEVVVTKFTKK
jgi:hypothetical protein